MNRLSNTASNQAANWANQKREAIEKAKRLREERKFNLAMTGEMALNNDRDNAFSRNTNFSQYSTNTNNNNNNNQPTNLILHDNNNNNNNNNYNKPYKQFMNGNKYGSSFIDRPPSQEQVTEARNSLKLLKSKLKDTGSFNSNSNNNGYYSNSGSTINNNTNYGNSNYDNFDNDGQGYYKKTLENDINTNDMYQNQNANYRKLFKPNLRSDNSDFDYGQTNSINSTNKNIQYRENQPNYGPRGLGNGANGLNNAISSGGGVSNSYTTGITRNKPPLPMKEAIMNHDKGSYNENQGLTRDMDYDYPSSKYNTISVEKKTENGKQYNTISTGKNIGNNVRIKGNSRFSDNMDDNDYIPPTNNSNKKFGSRLDTINANNANNPNNNPSKWNINNASNPKSIDDIPIPTLSKKTKNFNNHHTNNNFDEYPQQQDEDNEAEFIECPEGCGRKFNPQAIEKHAAICKKVFQSKRKKFDSSAARMTEELTQLQVQKGGGGNRFKGGNNRGGGGNGAISNKKNEGMKKKSKWKQQSEAFRASLKAARGQKLSAEEQKELNNAQQDDLVLCESCGRRFNEKAALKHIPFCQNKSKLDKIKQSGKTQGNYSMGNSGFKGNLPSTMNRQLPRGY